MTWTGLANKYLIALGVVALLAGCAAWLDVAAGKREDRAMQETPPQGRFVQVNGRQVHALVRGAGPDLVLIHGASGNLRDFTFDLVSRLEGEFRVFAFDRPGMGWSDPQPGIDDSPLAQADVLRSAAAQLGAENPVVLGHSYGGAVALGWALRARDDTAALVLLAPASHPWPGDLGLWYRLSDSWIGQRLLIPAVAALAGERQARGVVKSIFAPDPMPDGYAAHIGLELAMRSVQLRINASQVNRLRDHVEVMAPDYPALSMPIEIVHGTADTVVGISIHSERLAAEVASARLTRLEGAGHMPHHADPDSVVAAIHRAAARAGLR